MKNSRAERRRLAAAEERREKHAKLVVERHGDCRFTQRTRTSSGWLISLDPRSEEGNQVKEELLGARAAFVEKFGREPRPEDPIFFDPDAEEPTPVGADAAVDLFEEMLTAAEKAGLDPSHIHACREVGYMVTEMNQHLFSAEEVEAYLDAVRRHGDRPGPETADGDDGDWLFDEFDGEAAHGLEVAVGRTLLEGGDEQPAIRLVDRLVSVLDGPDGEVLATLMFGCLLGWLVGAKENGISSAAAVNWVNTHLNEDAASAAVRISGLIGYPFAPVLTVDEMNEELGIHAIAAMIWLAAGVVSTAGGSDANWLRQFDLF